MIEVGQKAPHFEGYNQDGKHLSLDTFKGKKLILYFYPEDDTPLCTTEACHLRDNLPRITSEKYTVLGCSPDTVESHKAFHTKFDLPFDLLADTEKATLLAYGAYGEKNMYGKIVMGVKRMTYLIDENGMVEKVVKRVISAKQIEQIFGK